MTDLNNEIINKISKFFKYASLIEAEILIKLAKKVQENSEMFVKTYSDKDYEQSISDIFDGVERTISNFTPKIENIKESMNKIVDFYSFKKNA